MEAIGAPGVVLPSDTLCHGPHPASVLPDVAYTPPAGSARKQRRAVGRRHDGRDRCAGPRAAFRYARPRMSQFREDVERDPIDGGRISLVAMQAQRPIERGCIEHLAAVAPRPEDAHRSDFEMFIREIVNARQRVARRRLHSVRTVLLHAIRLGAADGAILFTARHAAVAAERVLVAQTRAGEDPMVGASYGEAVILIVEQGVVTEPAHAGERRSGRFTTSSNQCTVVSAWLAVFESGSKPATL